MKKILNLFCLVFIITAISCEDYDSNTKTMDITNSKVNIKNGRLYFPTKSIFKEYMAKYIDASETELSKFFDPLYKEGFYCLRPIVTQENERLLYNNYIKLKPENPLKNTSKTTDDYFDYFDQIEEIIGDDVFAAFLNEKIEIQIEDIIYKYTDVGLFFAKEDKLDDLKNFLEVKNISEDLRYETPINSKQAIKTEFPLEGTTVINPDISYFKILYVDPNDQGGGGPPSYNPTQNGPTSSDPSYNVFLNNLQYCEPSHGLFGNLFGDNYVCIDRYENRRRVKTKAFNYNYLIVYHMGVKVHHQ
ncbi:MAG: hypothetical protein H7239_07860 [Flavobacterium sp.]|nr:hypothetical protein [Flavobacterium sp.]